MVDYFLRRIIVTARPGFVVWLCTPRCNRNCLHCYVKGRFTAELETKEAKRLIEEIGGLKPGFLSITGGEPLVRNDIFHLLEYAGDLMHVGVVTNGSLIDVEAAARLSRLDVYVSLSFDAATKETCELIRGKGAWERAVAAARALKENGVPFNPVMTITSLNVHEAGAFVNFAADMESGHASLIPLIPSGNADARLMPSQSSLASAIKSVEEVAEDRGFPVSLWCTSFAQALVKSPYIHPGGCSDLSMDIDPVGNVLLCDVLDFKLGNILEDGGKQAWRKMMSNPLYKEFRDASKLTGKCRECTLKLTCRGGCKARAYLTRGSFFTPDPLCPL
ncbi:MAG: radical SAM protein [Candidatus Jordarchaeales archaeon]